MRREQRKYKRFRTRGEVFAAFVIPDAPVIVGRVLDVSSRGVGVQYLSVRKLERGPTSVKIFSINSPQMERIESTVVYDSELPEEISGLPKMRRCGVKFDGYGLEVMTKVKRMVQLTPRGIQART